MKHEEMCESFYPMLCGNLEEFLEYCPETRSFWLRISEGNSIIKDGLLDFLARNIVGALAAAVSSEASSEHEFQSEIASCLTMVFKENYDVRELPRSSVLDLIDTTDCPVGNLCLSLKWAPEWTDAVPPEGRII